MAEHSVEHGDHDRIIAAGWVCRTNSRDWVIYQDPQTRLWQTHSEAISIIQAQVSKSKGERPGAHEAA
jgi:hypothetical protein